jgi:hypothetical protein
MSKRIILAMLSIAIVSLSFAVFSAETVNLKPEIFYRPSYMDDEWDSTKDTDDFPNPNQGGRYANTSYNTRWYCQCYFALGVVDQDFDGDLGVNDGRASSTYPYSYSYGPSAGTKSSAYTGVLGEGRTCWTVDLANNFSRMVWYDTDLFSPSADPTTDGWIAHNTLGGPSRHMSMVNYVMDGTAYCQNPGATGAYIHFWDTTNTTPAAAINLNLTVDKVLWVMQFRDASGIVDTANRYHEIVHTQPPLDQMTVGTFDNVFGNHSDGRSYVDRVVFRDAITMAVIDQYWTTAYGYGNSYCMVANNYPTTRTHTAGFAMLDEPGTVNDQYMYHGAGDDDPFINSFVADMRSGRYHCWFNFRAYRYYADNWPQDANYYMNVAVSYSPGSYTMVLYFGDEASAEDWVLYN